MKKRKKTMPKTRTATRARSRKKATMKQRITKLVNNSSLVTKVLFAFVFAALGSYLLISSRADACTQTLGPESNIATAVQNAAGGSTICLSEGQYPSLALQGQHSSDVTLTNVPGAKVTVGAGSYNNRTALTILANSSHIVVRNLYLSGGVQISADKTVSATYITIDHNDIAPIGMGINAGSVSCGVPNAPYQDPCNARLPIKNITISGNRIKYPKTTEQYGMEALAKYGFSGICDLSNPTCVQARDEGNIQQDALHFNNYDNLQIIGNEITNTVIPASGSSFWTSAHNDCFQSVYGGSNLVFDHNYEHDNNCQGFFIKDGDVTNARFTNNLFLRNRVSNAANKALNVYNVKGFVVRNNTDWASAGEALQGKGTYGPYDIALDHNVFNSFDTTAKELWQITENNNSFGKAPFSFAMSSTSIVNPSPQFIDTTKDDYRLANNPNGIGVNWKPADYVYGPIGIGTAPTPEPTPLPEPTPIPTPEPTPTPEPVSDSAHPEIVIKSPLNGSTVSGTVNISAGATDNVSVTSMALYIDGKLYSSSTTGTLTASWNTKPKRVTKGAHIITINASDAAGNTSSATVTVNVIK